MSDFDEKPDKFSLQNSQYNFPYHYIPHFDEQGRPRISRVLGWGLDYLCYMTQITEYVVAERPKSALDVGCGDGRLLGMLKGQVQQCVGCDLSQQAIAFAKAFHPEVDYRNIDVNEIGEQFDVVTAIEVLEHIPDESIGTFIKSLIERTKPGGAIILSVPSTRIKLSRKHFRHYDEALLEKHIKMANLQLDKVYSVRLLKHRDYVYQVFLRLTVNRHWNIEVPLLNKAVWNWIWNRRFQAEKGLHIVGIYRKPAGLE